MHEKTTHLPLSQTQTQANILWQSLVSKLFAPVDIASLVYFRLAFASIMLWEIWRYTSGTRIERYWIDPEFNFKYWGFGWVKPWPGDGMYIHFAVLAIVALCLGLGLYTRLSAILFFLGFTYIFLLEKAQYLNHFYLVSLVSFLLIFLPLGRAFSVDGLLGRTKQTDTVPAWTLWLLRFQIGVPYFFGGIAKINEDWLQGEPMRRWLSTRTDFPLIGQYFTQEWMVYAFSYGGLLLDLLVVPFLLFRPTRWLAFTAALLFHLMNARLFSIGIFPWFMIAATLMFFSPSWPRFGWLWPKKEKEATTTNAANLPKGLQLQRSHYIIAGLLAVWVFVQVAMPFQHLLYPGSVHWTEEGHNYAWHMKLRSKKAHATFYVTDVVRNEVWTEDPTDYLSDDQASTMAARPDLVLQFAQYLADMYLTEGFEKVEVRAEVWASLNGRNEQLLIDPTVDLAIQPRNLWHATWITDLEDSPPGQLAETLNVTE